MDFSILKPTVLSAISTLQAQMTTPVPRLAAFLEAVGDAKCELYLDHKIMDTQQQRAQFANLKVKFTEKLIRSLQDRFPDRETDLLNAMVIFDMQTLPTAATDLIDSGIEQLETLLRHYGVEKNGYPPLVECDACHEEWMLMKQLVMKNYSTIEMRPLWELICEKYRDTYPNLVKTGVSSFCYSNNQC